MNIAMTLLSGVGYGGVTYFANLIPALAANDKKNHYHLFVSKGHPLVKAVQQDNIIFHECVKQRPSMLKRFLWEQTMLPFELKRNRIDILFTAKNLNIFFAPCKTIISIRNAEPFAYREYENNWRLTILLWVKWQFTRWSVWRADHTVAVSQAVKDRLTARLPGIGKNVSVVYNGNPVPPDVPVQTGSLDVILSASKFVAYANQLNLLKGYAQLRQMNPNVPPLWLAGGIHDKSYFRKIQKFISDHSLEQSVKFLGLVPHTRLLELMRQARSFVFPSTLESCPHTLIEAMACHVPIAASCTPPMPEIGQDAILYFDPQDPNDIAATMKRLLDDAPAAQQRVRSARARADTFTWANTARGLLRVFERVQ
ncbi:glycosyltransferase family 4 protein [Candidatus Uhrbacteria bacterium]|nr:glycosyltransferase family 4 protein [Candidatus Uhrbacteria bacterium]